MTRFEVLSTGMKTREDQIDRVLKEFTETLPRFPDGRIDYSHSGRAPVLTCFVEYNGEILLLKRSDEVRVYQGKWNTVAGYLDEPKPIRQKAIEELSEELGIQQDIIKEIKLGEPYEFYDESVDKTWLVHPVLVNLSAKPDIKLDWEHTDFKWIKPKDIKSFDIVTNLDETLERALA